MTERWIDAGRLPDDVVALIEALGPGEDLVVERDGRPIATITGTSGAGIVDPGDRDGRTSSAYEDVTVVATAMKLSASARASLSARLGPDYIVLDLHAAPETAEVVLAPAVSPQLIGLLRSRFPKARVVIAEIEDEELGISYRGPVSRLLDAGADVYLPPSTVPLLAERLDRTVTRAREITGGDLAPLVIESPRTSHTAQGE